MDASHCMYIMVVSKCVKQSVLIKQFLFQSSVALQKKDQYQLVYYNLLIKASLSNHQIASCVNFLSITDTQMNKRLHNVWQEW